MKPAGSEHDGPTPALVGTVGFVLFLWLLIYILNNSTP